MELQGVNTHCRAHSSKYSPEKNVLSISCSHLYITQLCHILYLHRAHLCREKFIVLHFSVLRAQSFCSLPSNYWQFTGFTVYDQYLANEQAASISNMLMHCSKNMVLPWFLMAFHSFSSSVTDMCCGIFKVLLCCVAYSS